MIKSILRILLFTFLIVAAPISMYGADASFVNSEPIGVGNQDISISLSGTNLHVTGANGNMLNVYNLTGVCVFSAKVDSQDKRYDLNLPAGCYIVKVGTSARKVYIK